MAIVEITVEMVAAGVEHLLPEAAPVRPVAALRRGRNHASWVLDSSLGRLVGKVLLGEGHQAVLDRLAEHRRVWEHGVPVPRLLAFTSGSDAVANRMLIVSEFLEGRDAEQASLCAPDSMMVDAMRATGEAVARLHAVPIGTFGEPGTGLGIGPDTWRVVVASRVEALRQSYSEITDVAEDLVPAGLTLLGRLADEVSPVVRPAVAHLDLYLPNLLLDHEGHFRVLLDLEHVRRVDPVMDFVKPAMWMFTGRPAWAEAFTDGYRSSGGWPAQWSQRLAVASGLELLTGVEYWTRVHDHEMREDYQRRLRAWVRSDGDDHGWPSVRLR